MSHMGIWYKLWCWVSHLILFTYILFLIDLAYFLLSYLLKWTFGLEGFSRLFFFAITLRSLKGYTMLAENSIRTFARTWQYKKDQTRAVSVHILHLLISDAMHVRTRPQSYWLSQIDMHRNLK